MVLMSSQSNMLFEPDMRNGKLYSVVEKMQKLQEEYVSPLRIYPRQFHVEAPIKMRIWEQNNVQWGNDGRHHDYGRKSRFRVK